MSPILPEPSQNLPCPNGRFESLPAAVERALTVAEYTVERMLRTRRWLDFFRCIGWSVMVFATSGILLLILSVITRSTTAEWISSQLKNIDLVVYVMCGAFCAIAFTFAKREWDRLKSTYDRDNRYVGKLTDFLREALKPDDFPSLLEWYLYVFRISRFDIGPADPWIARDRERAAQQAKMVPSSGEPRTLHQGQVSPSGQSPQTTATSAS